MGALRTRCPGAVAAGLAAALLPAPAGAAEEGGARRVAVLAATGERAFAEALVVAAGSGVADLGVTLFVLETPGGAAPSPGFADRARELAAGSSALAAVWIDRGGGGTVFAAASGGAVDDVVVRRAGEEDPDAQIEAMAVIIRTAIEQILQAAPPPRPPPGGPGEAARTPPPPSAAPRPAAAVRLAQETEYAMHCASRRTGPVHGVNLRIGAALPRGVTVYAGYALFTASTVRTELATVEIARHPFHLGFRLRAGDRPLRFFAEANLVFDYVVPRVSSLAPGVVPEDAQGALFASALVVAGAGLRVHEVAAIAVAAGAEIPFNRARWVVGSGAGEAVVSEPWPVQPWVLAGLMLELL